MLAADAFCGQIGQFERLIWETAPVRAARYAVVLLAPYLLAMAGALAQTADELEALRGRVEQLFAQGNYAEALAAQRNLAATVEKEETAFGGKPARKTAEALRDVAWYALFARAYVEALAASERGLTIAPASLALETNRAHALLFVGRTAEALQLYLRHKGARLSEESDKPWEEVIAEDFDALRTAGIEHSAFPDLLRLLAVKNPESNKEIEAVSKQIVQLYTSGKYAEAAIAAETYVALARERFGDARSEFAVALNWLALCRAKSDRSSGAEALYLRAASIFERALGPDHPDVGTVLNNLGMLYEQQGRETESKQLLELARSILQLSKHRKGLGAEHPEVGVALNQLAKLYKDRGRYAAAAPLAKRALHIFETARGLDHPDVGALLSNLAELLRGLGRYTEAEPLIQRALTIAERRGSDHPDVGASLHSLALLYQTLGRDAEAEPLYQRAVAVQEKTLRPDHPNLVASLVNLAGLYGSQNRYPEALPLYQRLMSVYEKVPDLNDIKIAAIVSNIAAVYRDQGRLTEAEPLYRRALSIRLQSLGPDSALVANTLNDLAGLEARQGRYAAAEPLYLRALSIHEQTFGADHPLVAATSSNLAALYFAQQEWARAVEFWRRSTRVLTQRARRGVDDWIGQASPASKRVETEQLTFQVSGLLRSLHRLSEWDRTQPAPASESFAAAQWAYRTKAAVSLVQMAARGARGDPSLAPVVRERQDLVAEWQHVDRARTAALSQPPAGRNRANEAANTARLSMIDARITEIDKHLAADFPDYAALSRLEPLSVHEVQAQLRPNEALVHFLDTSSRDTVTEDIFIWVITKTDVRWVRSDLGAEALKREVTALRCGLDAALWDNEPVATRCRELLKTEPQRDIYGTISYEKLPFDTARAHRLYKDLFGQVEYLIRGKRLLVVPTGPLTQLPFQVLVTTASSRPGHRATQWLTRKHATTVLPAVSSLKALRRVAKSSLATKPMLGVGNPLLDGDPRERPWEAEWVKLAKEKQACKGVGKVQVAGLARKTGRLPRVAMRGGHADLQHLRSQVPLPDTADELCAAAITLKLTADDVLLGANATETTVKRLSAEGRLADYRVVYFATHGTLAGEIEDTSEPGLILTPPAEQTDTDDGYLSASEVAALKLDADWVILSACNTAAGGAKDAEALAGLSRAFIYAGARALLVSHWAVESAATARLVTSAVGNISREPSIGRAEALRQAMLTMIDQGEPRDAHPAVWAPFVVVGEGAAAK